MRALPDTLSHAYLITGGTAASRADYAKRLAAAYLCQGEHPPCGRCLPCRKVAAGVHPDVAFLTPLEGKREIVYRREDGEIFLGEGRYFQFYGEEVAITLYSDRSIEITREESPRHVCSYLGRVYDPYVPLVCLPNSFQATIVSSFFPEWDA